MPRDSNGTYSLPAGNPVVTETTITSTWANTTLDDIATALTDSLDRDGSGAMTGQLKLVNGTAGAPGLTFGTETNGGFYRAGAGDMRFSLAASDKFGFTAAGANALAPLNLSDGTLGAGTLALAFAADTDLGIYRSGANAAVHVANGAASLTVSTALTSHVAHGFSDGLVGTPGITFSSDLNTGIYRSGADVMDFAAGGAQKLSIGTLVTSIVAHAFADGTAGNPSITIASDPNTGLYSFGADQIGLTAGGTFRAVWSTTTHTLRLQLQNQDGTINAPGYSFENDPNTGVWRSTTDTCAVSHGGTGGAIGYRDGNKALFTGSRTLTQSDAGRVMQYNGTGGHTVTVPTSGVGEGFMVTLINSGSASVAIATSAGNLAWFTGAAVTTGSRTLAVGGVAVIMVNISATDAYVWGNAGLT